VPCAHSNRFACAPRAPGESEPQSEPGRTAFFAPAPLQHSMPRVGAHRSPCMAMYSQVSRLSASEEDHLLAKSDLMPRARATAILLSSPSRSARYFSTSVERTRGLRRSRKIESEFPPLKQPVDRRTIDTQMRCELGNVSKDDPLGTKSASASTSVMSHLSLQSVPSRV